MYLRHGSQLRILPNRHYCCTAGLVAKLREGLQGESFSLQRSKLLDVFRSFLQRHRGRSLNLHADLFDDVGIG